MAGAGTEFSSKNAIFFQGTTDGAGNLQPIEGTRQRAFDVFKVVAQISYGSALSLLFFLISTENNTYQFISKLMFAGCLLEMTIRI